MTKLMRQARMIAIAVGVAIGAAVVAMVETTRAQSVDELAIISPPDGTIVAPGDAVLVKVENRSGGTLTGVGVVGEDPIGFSGIDVSAPDSVFNLAALIPLNMRLGPAKLAALAATTDDATLSSPPLTIDIERPDTPVGLDVAPAGISFRFVGERISILVTARYADGTAADATASSFVGYASSDDTIASVDDAGIVTATGHGTSGMTSIVIKYGSQMAAVTVSIPPIMTGDLDGDGDVDQDDINILRSALDTPAAQPADARDLNHDGVINADDLTTLQSLCTRPGCATR
jgi:hypothetical protein